MEHRAPDAHGSICGKRRRVEMALGLRVGPGEQGADLLNRLRRDIAGRLHALRHDDTKRCARKELPKGIFCHELLHVASFKKRPPADHLLCPTVPAREYLCAAPTRRRVVYVTKNYRQLAGGRLCIAAMAPRSIMQT